MTLRETYLQKGIWMFSNWGFPKTLEIQGNISITIIGIIKPEYGCITVMFKLQEYMNQYARIEDIDTFIELFGGIEL